MWDKTHHNSSAIVDTGPDDTTEEVTTDDDTTTGETELVTAALSWIGQDLIQHRMLSQKNEDTDTNVTRNQAGIRRKLIACNGKL